MAYEGRAFYNLLQMNLKQNLNLSAEPWQVEEYRKLTDGELFRRIEALYISLDEQRFLLYVDKFDSPEDLTDALYLGEDYSKHEQVFLCVFELWRRLVPHKQSVSLFIDQLDHLIEEYEEGKLENEEELQAAIENFQIILDNHADKEGVPQEVYPLISSYSCHDLSAFMYEYISHQIDMESNLYASELLDGLYLYMDNKRWFDLLRIRLVSAVEVGEGNMMIERLLDSLKDNPELPLIFEVLHFLVYIGEVEQFVTTFYHATGQLKTEKDFCELLMLTGEYLELVNRGKEKGIIDNLIDRHRGKKDLHAPFDYDTPLLQTLKEIVSPPKM